MAPRKHHPPHKENRMQTVASLVHDEQRCVSVGGLSLQCGVSRDQAQQLLQDYSRENAVETTRIVETESSVGMVRMTTFSLKQSATEGPAYAVASNLEPLETAHERDAAAWRDAIQTGSSPPATSQTIRPSETLQNLMKSAADKEQPMDVEAVTPAPLPPSASLIGKRKKTTAKSFFSKKSSSTTAKPKSSKKPVEEGKENKSKTSNTESKVGNVDDFVGDAEDDSSVEGDSKPMEVDDDQPKPMEIDQPEKKQPKKAKKPAPVPAGKVKVTGTEPAKRRRKRLVDKSYVDENGYLNVEKQEIWEDIDEDEPASVMTNKLVPKKKTNKPKSNMKQGSLTGFFKKK